MATSPTTINILHGPIPASPLVIDAPDGNVRIEWRRFFEMLWTRTGSATPAGPAVVTPTTNNVMLWG